MLTLGQAAKRVNITRQTLKKWAVKLDIPLEKQGQAFCISEDYLQQIIEAIGTRKPVTSNYQGVTGNELLATQLKFLQDQLKEKDEQLKEMQTLLNQEQQLSMSRENRIKDLESKRLLPAPQDSKGILPTREWLLEFEKKVQENQRLFTLN